MKRLTPVAGGFGAGVIAAVLFAHWHELSGKIPNLLSSIGHAETTPIATALAKADEGHGHEHAAHGGHREEHGEEHAEDKFKIEMGAEQIDKAGIKFKPVEPGFISKRLRVPGTIVADRSRLGRVPSKVIGTVVELKKRLGDSVAAGEIVAILDSREVADARSEYIAASVNHRLQETLHQREKTLWQKQVSSEQRLLRSQATFEEAQVRRDVARQKLLALGVSDEAVALLSQSDQPLTPLERYEIKALVGGRIVEQFVDIGTPMGGEGQAHELFAIADLSAVWVELAVSTQDVQQIKEGQQLTIAADGTERRSAGTIIFINPVLNQDTRSARVVGTVKNEDGTWRPGSFVTAEIAVSDEKAEFVVPKAAIQSIGGELNVFVKTASGFEARKIAVGRDDGTSVEILSGVKRGDQIAFANTFLLKAELGKSEAEHVH